jgi:Fur family transcriptional regulator, iron response regulator
VICRVTNTSRVAPDPERAITVLAGLGQCGALDRFGPNEYKSRQVCSGDASLWGWIAPTRNEYFGLDGLMSSTIRKDIAAVDMRVREAGLRPTRQRVALANLLFAKGDRHLSAEELHEEALAAGVPVSLATVYNALHQFTEAGLLRILAIEGARTYFDTNVSDHHHFFVEGENKVYDIAPGPVKVMNLPEPPEGMEIANVDIIVRLRPKRA